MKGEKKFIGFDLGAESGRCIVAIIKEKKITLHEVHRFTTHNTRLAKGFHWNILSIYEEILEGLRKAQKNFGGKFDGIGIDTWGVDYVLIDPDDRIMGDPYHYRDARTDNIMKSAFRVISKADVYKRVGIQFAQYNTLFQLLAEKKNRFNQLNFAGKILLMPDFLNFLLCGEKRGEFSIASTTSLADPISRNWHWKLIDLYGFPRNIFPKMVEPGTVLGPILESVAVKVGLDKDVPVFASAGHDTASAVVSVPASKKNWAFLSSGTWSLMGVELEKPLLTPEAMKYNFTNEGGVDGTTRFLKNILGLWPLQECRRYWKEKGEEYSYVELAEMASKEGEVNAWVDLNDQRFFQAGEMPEKIKAYLQETGQTVKTNPGYIVRVVLESLAYNYRFALKQIEEVTGKKIEVLHAVGGGIQNELLTQFTADAIGRTVVAGPVEGTIIGNIGVIAAASGVVSNFTEWRKIVAQSFDVKNIQPSNSGYFDKNEANFKKILKNN